MLAKHATTLGWEIVPMTWKPFVRQQFTIEAEDVVAGSVRFVRDALQTRGKDLPRPNPYPESLRAYLHRRVWWSQSLGVALNAYPGAFVKPAKRWKLFTGFIPDGPNDGRLHGVSRREPVWCSEPVRFLSEWRVYVIRGEPQYIALSNFGGDRTQETSINTVAAGVKAYEASGEAPSAYAIDFGVLSTGETALIEVNDGFSVGAYDNIPASVYFDLIATRWQELAAMSAAAKLTITAGAK